MGDKNEAGNLIFTSYSGIWIIIHVHIAFWKASIFYPSFHRILYHKVVTQMETLGQVPHLPLSPGRHQEPIPAQVLTVLAGALHPHHNFLGNSHPPILAAMCGGPFYVLTLRFCSSGEPYLIQHPRRNLMPSPGKSCIRGPMIISHM